MLPPRISLALDEGWIVPPVVVLGAKAGDDPGDLPTPLTLVCLRQPDHDDLGARGFDVRTEIPDRAGTVIVHLPRERDLARDLVARAVGIGARVVVDGAKTDGIASMLKACRAAGRVGHVISKAHGKIFTLDGGETGPWLAEPARNADGFWTAPGSFSADGVDPGSATLAAALAPLKGSVADLGAGWGYLAHHVLRSPDVQNVHLVEADLPSLNCARRNIDDARAQFHWADATVWMPDAPVDHVIANPPFHTGRKDAPDLGRAFIANAARILAPRGTLWMVANRHLPYERVLTDSFAETAELPGTNAFKLYRASRPRRAR